MGNIISEPKLKHWANQLHNDFKALSLEEIYKRISQYNQNEELILSFELFENILEMGKTLDVKAKDKLNYSKRLNRIQAIMYAVKGDNNLISSHVIDEFAILIRNLFADIYDVLKDKGKPVNEMLLRRLDNLSSEKTNTKIKGYYSKKEIMRDYKRYSLLFSESNPCLEAVLNYCFYNDLGTEGCCPGHHYNKVLPSSSLIYFNQNDTNMPYLYGLMRELYDYQDCEIRIRVENWPVSKFNIVFRYNMLFNDNFFERILGKLKETEATNRCIVELPRDMSKIIILLNEFYEMALINRKKLDVNISTYKLGNGVRSFCYDMFSSNETSDYFDYILHNVFETDNHMGGFIDTDGLNNRLSKANSLVKKSRTSNVRGIAL